MTFSGAAMAQSAPNMMGGMEIPAEQWTSFQEKCAAINSAATQTLAQPNDESDDAVATGSVVANGEDDPNASSGSDPASQDEITKLLASLTPEQCKEAGL